MNIQTKLIKATSIGTKSINIFFKLIFSGLTYAVRKEIGNIIPIEEKNPYYGDNECHMCGRCCLAHMPDCAAINLIGKECQLYGTDDFPEECKDFFCGDLESVPIVRKSETVKYAEHIPYSTDRQKSKEIIQKRMKKRKREFARKLEIHQKGHINVLELE